jgi:hypothetical protein
MEESKTTIKKVYSEYYPQDFNYFSEDSTNLNPKREISLDNLDRIVTKLQEVTDDIIRKKIIPPEPEEPITLANLGGDTPAAGIPLPKQQLLAKTGGQGNAILFPIINVGLTVDALDKSLEYMIGTFPVGRLLDTLDAPPILDCEEILLQFTGKKKKSDGSDEEEEGEMSADDEDFFSESNDDDSDNDGDSGDSDSDSDSGGDEDEDESDEEEDSDDADTDDEDSGVKECMEIELTWLKIILIILKIIKILKMIIDLVLSILIPILQIVQWAVGAWINPPNIALIIQFIVELVTALIIMIIAWIIQLLWNLLNLDCIADVVASILAQIQEALSAFASIAGAFNPVHINLFLDKFTEEVTDPLQGLIDQAKSKKEDWQKFREQIKDIGGTMSEQMKIAEKQLYDGLQTGIGEIPQVQTVRGIYNQAQSVIKETQNTMKALKEAFDFKAHAENAAATGKAMLDAIKSKSKQATEFTAMFASPFVDLEDME